MATTTLPTREKEHKGSKDSKSAGLQLKTPKGTRDWVGSDILLRDFIFNSISSVFKRHGGTPLDTPVFELKEILAGKYGEDSRLIYDLQDQGGELCALRYDLTVPFARFLAMNNVQQIKRYQIAKVYRRDQPAIARGRLREFYQCDFDFAGTFDPMIPDAETLCIIVEVFEALGLDITIKINHRSILDGIFSVAGVPDDKIRPISSAIDKLDKSPWEEVKKEMEEKGLSSEVAEVIGKYVLHTGTDDIAKTIEVLRADTKLAASESIQKGLGDMDLLLQYLNAFGITKHVNFDLSLARGLDYYTGLIYEVIPNLPPPSGKKKSNEPQVGSIGAGGRYDTLAAMFGKHVPCVGISFGVDRIFTILKARQQKEVQREREVDVFVMAFGGGLLPERMGIARELWQAGIHTEFLPKAKPKLPQQFKAAESGGATVAVILGGDELAAGKIRVKTLGLPDDHPDKEGKLVDKQDLVSHVKSLLQKA